MRYEHIIVFGIVCAVIAILAVVLNQLLGYLKAIDECARIGEYLNLTDEENVTFEGCGLDSNGNCVCKFSEHVWESYYRCWEERYVIK